MLHAPCSYRCPYCDKAWPRSPDFATCPRCQEPTANSTTAPVSIAEAAEVLRDSKFGWYLVTQWLNDKETA